MSLRGWLRAPTVRGWLLAAGALVLALIAAAATPEGFGGFLGAGPAGRRVLPEALKIHEYLFIALFVLTLCVFVAARLIARREGIIVKRPRASPARLLAGLFLLLLIVNAVPALRERLDDWFDRRDERIEQPEQPGALDDEPAPEPSRALGYLIAGVMVLAAAGLVGVLWLLLGRERARGGGEPEEELSRAQEAGLRDLASISDPRAAVMAAYARLQRAADEAAVGRRASDAPYELLDLLLEDGRADPTAARSLTDLFEIARFSPHEVDEGMRADAVAALHALRGDLVTAS